MCALHSTPACADWSAFGCWPCGVVWGNIGRIKAWARKRDGLVPIGEALADLPGPAQALRETPPPARRHFTQADQVDQLVTATEAAGAPPDE